MKTTTNSNEQHRPGRKVRMVTKGLLPLLGAGTLVSCGTHAVGTAHSSPTAAELGHRYTMQHDGRTDLPKPAPAEERNPAWDRSLEFGDDEGSRSMIPIELLRRTW